MVPLLLALSLGQEPPRLLPTSITGKAPPVARFMTQAYPPDTVAGVQAVRSGADWLARQTLPNGRLTPGFDPRTGKLLDADHELRQATAARALAEAAAFTGDERLQATAAQAVLGLLTLTREANGVRTPTVPADRCNPVAFAATLLLALDALPNRSRSRWPTGWPPTCGPRCGRMAASAAAATRPPWTRTASRRPRAWCCKPGPPAGRAAGADLLPGRPPRTLRAGTGRRPAARGRHVGDTAAVFELADRLTSRAGRPN